MFLSLASVSVDLRVFANKVYLLECCVVKSDLVYFPGGNKRGHAKFFVYVFINSCMKILNIVTI